MPRFNLRVDLAADNHILAVIGPICAENSADFAQRMIGAQKISISPVPFRSIPSKYGISFTPNIDQLIDQSTAWIENMGFSRIIITHDIDESIHRIFKKIMRYFQIKRKACQDLNDGSTDPQIYTPEAAIEVFYE